LPTSDQFILLAFLFTALQCLLFSTIFHVFLCHHSSQVYDRVATLDYTGIAVLNLGSFSALIYFGLYCHDWLRHFYLGLNFVLSSLGVILPWFSFFRSVGFRVWRTVFFVSLSGLVSVMGFHSLSFINWEYIPWIEITGEIMCYLIGAFIYVKQIPEAYLPPGHLDIWLHSHQIWHALVFCGAYFHWHVVLRLSSSTEKSGCG
jgi:adiponectin receptor